MGAGASRSAFIMVAQKRRSGHANGAKAAGANHSDFIMVAPLKTKTIPRCSSVFSSPRM